MNGQGGVAGYGVGATCSLAYSLTETGSFEESFTGHHRHQQSRGLQPIATLQIGISFLVVYTYFICHASALYG